MMDKLAKHFSLNVTLIQARESLISYFRPALHEAGITEQQWRIIRLLAENGTMDFQDLANRACILRPSLTGILNRLEKLGYVVRLKPSNDQRRVFLKLTSAGETLYSNLVSAIDSRYEILQQRFNAEKMQQLDQLLKELVQSQHQIESENQ